MNNKCNFCGLKENNSVLFLGLCCYNSKFVVILYSKCTDLQLYSYFSF